MLPLNLLFGKMRPDHLLPALFLSLPALFLSTSEDVFSIPPPFWLPSLRKQVKGSRLLTVTSIAKMTLRGCSNPKSPNRALALARGAGRAHHLHLAPLDDFPQLFAVRSLPGRERGPIRVSVSSFLRASERSSYSVPVATCDPGRKKEIGATERR